MVTVVGVRFKKAGKIYYFDPDDQNIDENTYVIVETARGIEMGKVVLPNREVDIEEIVAPLKKVIRIATEEDIEHHKENIGNEKEAMDICLQKIKEHNLDMKLIDVEYTFDNNKILFYFTADGRIDFRELVKDLAAIFKTRIELRQIGVRDETKMMGGIGICGRVLCCRLMCCLKYEHEAYEEVLKKMPKVGALVSTPEGQGIVIDTNLLKETAKIKLENENENEPDLKIFNICEIKVIKDVAYQQEVSDLDLEALKELED